MTSGALTGSQVASFLADAGVTHVVSLPDSTIGPWHAAIAAHPKLRLVRVCREGEAWAIAAGLHFGGAMPVVLIQCTGLFESGDSLRNVVHDWKLPIFSLIGYRSYLNQDTLPGDTCLVFTEPLMDAWKLDWMLVQDASQAGEMRAHYDRCRAAGVAGALVIAEGRA
ncbi:MAG: thiamine pyrophosphate-binding protein [Gemmatimonadota bacterium]|nr:thiamine pyrophosphate-binding protein [Gemmatimonadota bacterium]